MNAYIIRQWGNIDAMKLEEVDVPQPKPGEVVIAVRNVGVNPLDYVALAGHLAEQIKLPAIIGWDVAGTVEAVADDVQTFKVSDEVLGFINFPATDGTLAGGGYSQFVAAPAAHLTKKPVSLPFDIAAGLPIAGLTAWQGIIDHPMPPKAGQRVLIHGSAGGVGHFAVQIAKQTGAHVIATARAENIAFVQSLGADEVIDYNAQPFQQVVHDIDFVFDSVGGDTLRASIEVLKEGGALTTTLGQDFERITEAAAAKQITAQNVRVHPNATQLAILAQQVADGTLTVHVEAIYPFQKAPDAIAQLRDGSIQGKLVIDTTK